MKKPKWICNGAAAMLLLALVIMGMSVVTDRPAWAAPVTPPLPPPQLLPQATAPAAAPARPMPPPPIVSPPPGNPISEQGAIWIQEALQKLAAEKSSGTAGAWLSSEAAAHPLLHLLICLRGLLGLAGLPIHTLLDHYLRKNLSTEQYGTVKKAGSTVLRQVDWLVNLAFSIKPTTVMAAYATRKEKAPAELTPEQVKELAIKAGLLPAPAPTKPEPAYAPKL